MVSFDADKDLRARYLLLILPTRKQRLREASCSQIGGN